MSSRASRDDHLGGGLATQLHSSRANAATPAVDEGGLARAQASFAEQVDKSREKDLADGSAPREVAVAGQGQQMGGGNGYALGVPAAGEQAEDAVAGLPLRYGRAGSGDHARHFQAHIGGRARGRRVVASALEEIGAIDGCGMDIDEDLARDRRWGLGLLASRASGQRRWLQL